MDADQAEGDRDQARRLVAAFLSGVRSAAVRPEDWGWSQACGEEQLALCDSVEQLGDRGAFEVVVLCCGRGRVQLRTAVETIEAVLGPAG